MKKIININFHSRVVPIEETAYEILQQYIDSLRRYFAGEEGRDEIISDIENRFAELFSETLKKGATCITDADVNAIIASMGRPEDFEQEEMAGTNNHATSNTSGGTYSGQQAPGGQQGSSSQYTAEEPRRLFRSSNDKILGGVCAGLANYLRLDPAIVRILFVLITFGWGAGVLLYIILWAVLPNKPLPLNVRKRLYRNPDDRVIAGVASGLAAYFHMEVWIPRLIFALPLILGVFTSVFRKMWWWHGPVFFTGGFGGTLVITYIVLWIVLPEALTASEKLEMRGEKVDLESIKNTIKSDLEGFKGRAKDMGNEMKEKVQQMGQEMGQQVRQTSQNFASEAGPVIRRTGTGLGHAIGVLFKVFFLFIAGVIAFALITALAGLVLRGDGVLTIKEYILSGFWQNFLAWAGFFLFLVIPVIALLTWLIRRIVGVRTRAPYLGYIFATLWVIGLFCCITLGGLVFENFRSRQHVEQDVNLVQPSHGKLMIRAIGATNYYYDTDWWFDNDWRHNGPFFLTGDSLMLNTIRVNLLKSVDSNYHVQIVKFSHGSNSSMARNLAEQIVFPVRQEDSVLFLADAFAINPEQKFRNQQVLVAVAIPVGKKIQVNKNIDRYRWFTINSRRSHIRWNEHWDDNGGDWNGDFSWNNSYSWNDNVEYIMTNDGLVRTDKKHKSVTRNRDRDEDNNDEGEEYKSPGDQPKKAGRDTQKTSPDNNGYRYRKPAKPAGEKHATDSSISSGTAWQEPADAHLYLLSALLTL